MKRLLSRTLLAAPFLLMLGCQGSSEPGGSGQSDDEGGAGKGGSGGKASGGNGGTAGGSVANPGKLSDRALERNPKQTLECPNPAAIETGQTPFVRLTNAEYFNTLRDLLAPVSIDPLPELPGETIIHGFWNNAEGQSASDDLINALESGARSAGSAVATNLDKLKIEGCPPSGSGGEEACADRFISDFGRRAWRRPLDDGQKGRLKDFYRSMRGTYDFSTSINLLVQAMLQSPDFLYRVEAGAGKVANTDKLELSQYEMASRISYLLWDTMPDATLFQAAEQGKLTDAKEVENQVARMLGDDRAKGAVWEFARQWLDTQRMSGLAEAKNPMKFPSWSPAVASALNDGLQRFVQDSLLGDGGGINKLLTSNKAWVNDKTAAVYGVNAPSGGELGAVDLDSAKRTGLLTQGFVMAGLAKPANHSPVLRGVFVLEQVMCAPPPPPPNGMIPPALNPLPADAKVTTRQRLVMEHEGQGGSCKACHVYIDGVGFGFEHYDAAGQYQTKEDGLDVDSSMKVVQTYDVNGDYKDGVELARKLGTSEQVAQCFSEHWYRYALARSLAKADEHTIKAQDGCNIAFITDAVVNSKGDFKTLMNAIVKSPAFRYRSPFAN